MKKTPLEAYSRPRQGGIIAIKLREDDELVDVVVTKAGDEVVLATADGMAIRFSESDARPMGRNTSGVKGIKLGKGDELVGMVVADADATLLTACENGFGKRTNFGTSSKETDESGSDDAVAEDTNEDVTAEGEDEVSSSARYRTQRRGGKGLRDIKTTKRNGKVIGVTRVTDDDELMMMTARGKIQRVAAQEISVIGRNTQGVRIMSLDDDKLAAIVRVPRDDTEVEQADAEATPPQDGSAAEVTPPTVGDAPAAEDTASDEQGS